MQLLSDTRAQETAQRAIIRCRDFWKPKGRPACSTEHEEQTLTGTHTGIYAQTYTHACACTHVHTYTHAQTHMCVPTCMYIYMELAYKVGLNSQSICLYLCGAKHICSLTLKRAIKISVAIPRHKHSLCRPLVMLEYLQRTCIFPQVKCILKKQT